MGRKKRTRFQNLWRFCIFSILITNLILIAVILTFRWINPPRSALMLFRQRQGEEIRQEWLAYEDIPNAAILAVIVAEDQKFFDHWGFDFESIQLAWHRNQNNTRKRGASTISQQVVKNLFLWPQPSYWRKGIEAYCTVWLELLWPKRRILEVYLNIAELAPGIFGFKMGCQHHFAKTPQQMTHSQIIALCAILPNPRQYSPVKPSRLVQRRINWVDANFRLFAKWGYLEKIQQTKATD